MNDTKGHACRVCRRRGVVGDTGFPSTIYCRKVSEIIKYCTVEGLTFLGSYYC